MDPNYSQILLFASAVSFAIQQSIELSVNPVLTGIMLLLKLDQILTNTYFGFADVKKIILSWISFGIGLAIVNGTDFNIFHKLDIKILHITGTWEAIISAMVISNGTDLTNSLVKWIGYQKDVQKAQGQVSVNITTPNPVVTVAHGATTRLVIRVQNAVNTDVLWQIQEGLAGGTIDATGLYTAPSAAGQFHVVVSSKADPTAFQIIVVNVT